MKGRPPPTPTLGSLSRVLPAYGGLSFDRALEKARSDVGGDPDPADPGHAARMRQWLNQWTCRIGYPAPGEADLFITSRVERRPGAGHLLPDASRRLAQLTDADLLAASRSYASLYTRPATISRDGVYFFRPSPSPHGTRRSRRRAPARAATRKHSEGT